MGLLICFGMNERQEQILKAIVEEYVASAEPVASKVIAEKHDLDVSSATVRNDMAELEAEGFIRQPHTSAGRVPTEKGYQFYIGKFAEPELKKDAGKKLRQAVTEANDPEEAIKSLAKELVQMTGDMAIAAFGSDRSFFTGMGSLMQKPDFQNLELVQTVSTMLDHFDEVVNGMMQSLEEVPQVMIGEENPFGKETAAVVVKFRRPDGKIGLIGLVGPMRMNYPRNLGLMGEVIDILNDE